MKRYCPECGCTMTWVDDVWVCDDYECAYQMQGERDE